MADRDVKVRIELVTAGNAAEAMRSLAGDADRAAALTGKAATQLKSLDPARAGESAAQLKAVSDAATRAEQATKALGQAQSQLKAPGPQTTNFAASQPTAQASSSINFGQAFANAAASNVFKQPAAQAVKLDTQGVDTATAKLSQSLRGLASASDQAAASVGRATAAQRQSGTGLVAPQAGFPIGRQTVNPQALLSGTPPPLGNQGRPPIQTPQAAAVQTGQPQAAVAATSGAGPPGGLAGAFGPVMAALGSFAAAIKFTEKALTMAAAAADAYSDSTLSAEKRNRRIAEALDPTGIAAALGKLTDVISGKTEEIRSQQRESQKNTALTGATTAAYQQSLPLMIQREQLQARSRAEQSVPMIGFNPPERGGNYGDLNYAQYERRQPLELNKRRAEIEQRSTTDVAADLRTRTNDLQQQYDRQRIERQKLLAQAEARQQTPPIALGGPGNQGLNLLTDKFKEVVGVSLADIKKKTGFGVNNLNELLQGPRSTTLGLTGALESSGQDTRNLKDYGKVKEALEKEEELRQKLIATGQAQSQAEQQAAQAASNLRKANIALAQEELNALKEKENLIKGQAQAFGQLNALERQAATEAAKRIKKVGYEAATPEEKQLIAAAGGGQFLQAESQKSALKDERFKQFNEALGLEYDLKENQKKQVQVAATVQADIQLDEQKLATDLEKVLVPLFEKLIKTINDKIRAIGTQVEVEQRIGSASQ